jgi:hypothetical protein
MKHSPQFLYSFFLVPAVLCSLAAPAAAVDPATIQTYLDQFKKNAGARVETLAIMGGEDGASGGAYSFNNNRLNMSINKAGGRGIIGDPKDFDFNTGGIHWLPLLGGSIGYSESDNKFTNIPALANNLERYISFSMGFEAGARVYFSRELSIGPMLGFIYSHAHSSFEAGSTLGQTLKEQYSKQLVDWNMDTMSVVPSLDIQYEHIFAENWRMTLSSRFAWFHTWDIATSSKYLGLSGNSSYWENKADLDIRLPIKVFGHALHTGGFVSAGLIGGDFAESINTNSMYTFNGRLVVGDITGLWKLNWIGLGASYIKSSTFDGISWGIDARLIF